MIHLYQAPKTADSPIFFFLHGTGGTEQDLVGLVSVLDSEAG